MSGGGDVRVLRQEAGQESPRMPAWKREILERRKAKGGGSVEAGPSGQMNGSGRNYSITAAGQHFKEPRAAERTEPRREEDGRESLVLQESLGPLQENPFMKLEQELRRRQERESAARPVQHLLELYGRAPGVRTIRAENIIIIETDPDYFPESGRTTWQPNSTWQPNGVDGPCSLEELLDRRGSSVTEIRAREVVIYDTTLSRSEENLSTLGRHDPDVPRDQGQGRVSRILQKFDSNYGKLQKKSHSTENLLDLDLGASRPRLWSKPQPDLVPNPAGVQPTSPVFQSSCSSKPKPQPVVSEPCGPQGHPGAPQSVSSHRQRFEDRGLNGATVVPNNEPDRVQSGDREGSEVSPKPKVPCSTQETRRAESSLLAVSSKVLKSSPEFEIRPSVKPDLEQIPDGDAQARALANLRLQSRNSFTVIPKRRLQTPPPPPDPVGYSPRDAEGSPPRVPTPHASTTPSMTTKRKEDLPEKDPDPPPAAATSPARPPSPVPSLVPSSPPVLVSPPSSPAVPSSPPSSPVSSPSPTAPGGPTVDHLPVTNIDDIEVEPSQRVPSPAVQKTKKGNTFTVVPKRSAELQKGPPETQQEVSGEAPPGSAAPQAPFAQLGTQLKKRYPAVEEIQVIGGYQSLAKSCLSKTGSLGKKLTISFNESRLQSTYEYPSESSAWDSGEEDGEDKRDEQPSMVGRIHIPRPGLIGSDNGNDLSSYVPKHSVDFSAWQENKHEETVRQEDAGSPQITEVVMLTPADSSSLSDYSSEPALYF